MASDKLMVCAARRMRKAWCQLTHKVSQDLDSALDRLEQTCCILNQARRRFDRSRLAPHSGPPAQRHDDLEVRLRNMLDVTEQAQDILEKGLPTPPSASSLLQELRQIDADIGGLKVDIDQKSITAITESITLKDLVLGPFAIRFFWDRLQSSLDYKCFDLVALEPNPAGANESVTHPHVKHETLCAGEATVPLKSALEQGRLADAFNLIHGVLTTYNPGSPHVAIDEWDGAACHDCGSSMDSDDGCHCEACRHDFCEDCITVCAVCSISRCAECLTPCDVCESRCYSGCVSATAGSDRQCCSGCLCTCPTCQAVFATDEKAEGSELCPGCRDANPVSPDATSPSAQSPMVPVSPSQESPDETDEEFCIVAAAPG